MKKIVVFAPHPDDETLGCGGTILKHISKGHRVYWVILTNMYEEQGFSKDRIKKRQNEILRVSNNYKFTKVYQLNFPAAKLDTIPKSELVTKISNIIVSIKPEEVFLNFGDDIHSDHQVASIAINSSIKSFRHEYIKRVSVYETLSETHFQSVANQASFEPNYFVDISKFIKKKCQIMQIYKSELMRANQPRTIDNLKALAKFRGSRCMSKYAEAFITIYNAE